MTAAMADTRAVVEADEEEDEKEPFYMRMTPMELDMQLQAAEYVFRELLKGNRVAMGDYADIKEWEESVLGPEWCAANDLQRKEVLRQVRADGENSPAWMEALAHMGDIAWEVFECGERGERMRSLEATDRLEIIEQLKELKHKVKISFYARCGAGDRFYGFRACIAIFRTFCRDSEMLDLTTSVMISCIEDHEFNRDGLTCLTVPAPPLEREPAFKDRGWTFLRNSLDAFVVQAGGEPQSKEAAQETMINSCSANVAMKLAKLITLTADAPAVLAQLKLVHEAPPENAWLERKDLVEIINVARAKIQELRKTDISDEQKTDLQKLDEMLDQKP